MKKSKPNHTQPKEILTINRKFQYHFHFYSIFILLLIWTRLMYTREYCIKNVNRMEAPNNVLVLLHKPEEAMKRMDKKPKIYWMCVAYSIDIVYQVFFCVLYWACIVLVIYLLHISCSSIARRYDFHLHTQASRERLVTQREGIQVQVLRLTIQYICKPIDIWSLIDIGRLHMCPFIRAETTPRKRKRYLYK